MSAPQDLYQLDLEALLKAYAHDSNYKVACAIRTASGRCSTAPNAKNSSLTLSSCADKNTMIHAVHAGHQQITEADLLAMQPTIGLPCAAGRQCLQESSMPNLNIHRDTTQGLSQAKTVQ